MTKLSRAFLLPLIVAVAGITLHGQAVLRAGLQIHLNPTKLDYARPLFGGQGGYFRDEPVTFEVLLLSRFPDAVSGAETDWLDRVQATLWSGGIHNRTQPNLVPLFCDARSATAVKVKRAGNLMEIDRGGSTRVRCRLDTRALKLSSGMYTLSVGWHPQLKSTAYRELKGHREVPAFLDGFAEFEVRDVQTNDERLDLLNHRARVALKAGNLREALEAVDDILVVQPRSVSALTTLARVKAARKDCRQALRDWQTAIAAIEQELDTGNQSLYRLTPEERREFAASLRAEQRSLLCN